MQDTILAFKPFYCDYTLLKGIACQVHNDLIQMKSITVVVRVQIRICTSYLINLIGYETLRWLIYPRNHEELRSGTWMTIRYAKKIGKKLVIIWPNGEPCED